MFDMSSVYQLIEMEKVSMSYVEVCWHFLKNVPKEWLDLIKKEFQQRKI